MSQSYVIIPAYNEGPNLGAVLEQLRQLSATLPLTVLVVNDGSRDNTLAQAERFRHKLDLEIITHPVNLGVPRTFYDGLVAAAAKAQPADCIFIIEGDGTSDLEVMPEMARRIYSGDDVVIASRYIGGGGYLNFPWQRTLGSYVINFVVSGFFHVRGITDYTIFYRAYRAEPVQQALRHFGDGFMTTKSFAANLEVLLRVLPFCQRFSEVPLLYDYGLKKSKSKMNVFKTLREYQGLIIKRLLHRI
jgi:dolichol-phosphate mannosyltransferase